MEDGSFHMAATSRNLKDTQNYSDLCAMLLAAHVANGTCYVVGQTKSSDKMRSMFRLEMKVLMPHVTSPCIDEVLSQADVCRGPGDGDLTLR